MFLTKAQPPQSNGHMVVVRSGPVLQELQLVTSLSRDQIKVLLQSAVVAATK